MRNVFASAVVIAMFALPSVVFAGDLGETISKEDAFAWFPSCTMTSAFPMFPKPDYIVSPSTSSQYSYTKLSLAVAAAHVTGDRDSDGKIRICIQGGNPQSGPIVYYDNASIYTGQWSMQQYGTGNEDIIIYGSSPAQYTLLSSQIGAGVPVLKLHKTIGERASRNVVLKNVRVTGGNVQNGSGAGIYVSRSRFELENAQITNNRASGGAGMFIDDSDVTIRSTRVWDNHSTTSEGGGAVVAGSILVLVDTSWDANTSSSGGALSVYNGSTMDVSLSEFSGNTASNVNSSSTGGAIRLVHSNGRFENTSFTSNSTDGRGGAVFASFSDIELVSVVVKANHADTGGAFEFYGISDTDIIGSTFIENTTQIHGGALAFSRDAISVPVSPTEHVSIQDSIFEANVSDDNGGAIYVQDSPSMSVRSSTFIGNTAQTGRGGAIYRMILLTPFSSFALLENAFESNTAQISGGAVYTEGYGDFSIETNTFIDNDALIAGGAVLCEQGTLLITEATFQSNNAGNGGALYQEPDCALTVEEVTFDSNSASVGGAMYLKGELTADMTTFINNTVSDVGGAIYAFQADVNMTGSAFTSNSASQGGAIAAVESNIGLSGFSMNANSSTISSGNLGWQGGGSILAQDSSVDLSDGSIINNSAVFAGGGILVLGSSAGSAALVADAVTASGNSSQTGGVLLASNASIGWSSSVLENNTASNSGGAWRVALGDVAMDGLAFIQNSAQNGGAVYFMDVPQLVSNDVVFDSNIAVGTTADGGAVHVSLTNWTSSNDRFVGNSARYGGAVYSGNSDVVFSDVVAVDNAVSASSGYGGGGFLYGQMGSDVSIFDGAFINNSVNVSSGGGGALWLQDSNLATDGIIATGNHCYGSNCVGGFFKGSNGTFELLHVNAQLNTADSYGGIAHITGGNTVISNSILANNWSSIGAPVLFVGGAQPSVEMEYVTIAGNTVGILGGSAILLSANTIGTINDSILVMNDRLELHQIG